MRTILYPLIFILSLSLVQGSLEDYPEPFVKDHYADNLALVVSESEVTLYSIVSADIASGLAPVKGNTKTLLDKELLTGYQNHDLILIGGPCENKLTAKFLSNKYCTSKSGEARIKLIDNGNNKALIVMGYDFDAIRNAGLVLRNYKNYNLIGDDMTITKSGSRIMVSETSGIQIITPTTQVTQPAVPQAVPEGCQGCMVDKTCIQNEKRLFDEYCQDSILYTQKEDNEKCSYNYECISDRCSKESICIKPTILNTIIAWVKGIFQRFI